MTIDFAMKTELPPAAVLCSRTVRSQLSGSATTKAMTSFPAEVQFQL
jgi:hypothetical protein